MQVKVLFFGPLAEMMSSEMMLDEVKDTDALINQLKMKCPQLATHKYAIAVNKKITDGNTALADGFTVALLPPFSGG